MKSAALRTMQEESKQPPYLIRRREGADAQDRNLAKGVLAGLIAGLIGTIVMTQFQNAWSKVSEGLQNSNGAAKNQSEREQQGQQQSDDATMKAAGKIAQLGGRQLSHDEKKKFGPMVHYSFGTLQGALYGGVIELTGSDGGFLAGLIFCAALFTVGDEIAVPALGLSGKATESPLSSHLYGLAAHLVYGATAEITRRGLRAAL